MIYRRINVKKKIKTSYGSIEVNKNHPLGQMHHCFAISPYLLHLMLYIGQQEVFKEGQDTFNVLLQLLVSSTQIQRVCETFGKGTPIEEILQTPLQVDQTISIEWIISIIWNRVGL